MKHPPQLLLVPPRSCEQRPPLPPQRLRDKGPMVRATAARGIVRLMDCGDDGSYSDCDVMTIMMSMLGSDTSKDVRLSIVSYVPVCERSLGPIILRSR